MSSWLPLHGHEAGEPHICVSTGRHRISSKERRGESVARRSQCISPLRSGVVKRGLVVRKEMGIAVELISTRYTMSIAVARQKSASRHPSFYGEDALKPGCLGMRDDYLYLVASSIECGAQIYGELAVSA
ncbi:MAG: hypothetical protein RIS36_1520 [Pseudomonadota bacterium]